MEYLVGLILAVVAALYATLVGLDRERGFYPTVLIVIALIYILFASTTGSMAVILAESVPALFFITAATLGFRRNPWFAVAGLALHGVFDFFHHGLIANPGVPVWWPGFCLTYDVVAAVGLAVLIRVRRAKP